MFEFETYEHIDEETGTVHWTAYFEEDCGYDPVSDDILPNVGARHGIGDTALEAIANLCLDEIARLAQAAGDYDV